MSKYLVKLKPCEAYFFGDENTFRIGEEKENYFIKSLKVPQATSVTGMLRYVLLEQNGILNTDLKYNDDDRKRSDALIGTAGYCVEAEKNDLGAIKKSISPLFVMDEGNNIYIPTPLNHKTSEKSFTPLVLSEEKFVTSEGEISLPLHEEFNAKETVGDWYMNIATGEIVKDMFETEERVGIDKEQTKDAFFKKSYCNLKSGYSFAFVCEVDCEIKDTICYMGRERSAFVMTVAKTELDIVKEIENNFDGSFYYAFSDLILKSKIKYNGFSMVKTGSVRMLKSVHEKGRLKISRQMKHYNVIKSGSVFAEMPDKGTFFNEGYGLNTIIKLGGKKK